MNRFVVITRVGSDGTLHFDHLVGAEDAGTEVQVTVAPVASAGKGELTASDLLNSGLVGIWADRTDIGESLEYARRVRQRAQTRKA